MDRGAYADSGLRGYWQTRAEKTGHATYNYSKYGAAIICVHVGEKEEAFKLLRQAVADRDHSMAQSLKVHPVLDELRDDPRFGELLRRVGLAP